MINRYNDDNNNNDMNNNYNNNKNNDNIKKRNNNKKDVGFLNVNDPNLKNELIKVSKCPDDATNFIFWYNKNDPNIWGLTIKSIIKKYDDNYPNFIYFNSQHTWKITWYNYENKCLKIAQNSKSLAEDIENKDYDIINKIFILYKNK
jgi:hypothetical protein